MSWLKERAIPLSQVPLPRLTTVIHGDRGTGKTTVATSFGLKEPGVILDFPLEQGTSSLLGLPYQDNLARVSARSVEDIHDLRNALKHENHDFGWVCIDSAPAMQSMFWRHICGWDPEDMQDLDDLLTGGDGRQRWGEMKEMMTEVVSWFIPLATDERHPMHVIFTASSESAAVEGTDRKMIWPQIAGQGRSILLGAVDHVLWQRKGTLPQLGVPLREGDDPEKVHFVTEIGPNAEGLTKVRLEARLAEKVKIPKRAGIRSPFTLPAYYQQLTKAYTMAKEGK